MGSRTSSVLDFKSSQNEFKTSSASIGKIDLESIRTSTKNVAALDLDNKIIATPAAVSKAPPKPIIPEPSKKPPPPEVSKSPAPAPIIPKPPVKAPITRSPPKLALDGNQNATTPTLPVIPPTPRKPVEPDPLVKMFPKKHSPLVCDNLHLLCGPHNDPPHRQCHPGWKALHSLHRLLEPHTLHSLHRLLEP